MNKWKKQYQLISQEGEIYYYICRFKNKGDEEYTYSFIKRRSRGSDHDDWMGKDEELSESEKGRLIIQYGTMEELSEKFNRHKIEKEELSHQIVKQIVADVYVRAVEDYEKYWEFLSEQDITYLNGLLEERIALMRKKKQTQKWQTKVFTQEELDRNEFVSTTINLVAKRIYALDEIKAFLLDGSHLKIYEDEGFLRESSERIHNRCLENYGKLDRIIAWSDMAQERIMMEQKKGKDKKKKVGRPKKTKKNG